MHHLLPAPHPRSVADATLTPAAVPHSADFFRCEEVDAATGRPLELNVPPPSTGLGMVDSLMPQWDQTGQNWEITAEDRRMLAEYEAWLPEKIFDARALFFSPHHPPRHPGP